MGCGPRIAGTLLALLAALALAAAPALAGEPAVYVSPFVPETLMAEAPVDGTVVMTVMVWTGTRWAQESMVMVPAESLASECTVLPGGPRA